MFGKKSDSEKLPAPRAITPMVEKYMISEMKINPEWIPLLRAVVRNSSNGDKKYDIRILDELDAKAKEVKVENFLTLNEHPDLILYEGWFDDGTKKVELIEKKKANLDTRIYNDGEITQQIEALKTPGSTIFFYQARGPGYGGPLGMGAAVVELNPAYDGKKQKKYRIYFANVIDGKPVEKRSLTFQTDKVIDVTKFIKDGHVKRQYAA